MPGSSGIIHCWILFNCIKLFRKRVLIVLSMSQAFKHDVNQWHHQPSYVPLRSFALQSTGRLNLFQGYFKNFADSWFLIYTILVEFVVLVVMVTMLIGSTIWIYPCDENPHSLIRISIVDRSYTYLLISWSSLVIWPPSIVG